MAKSFKKILAGTIVALGTLVACFAAPALYAAGGDDTIFPLDFPLPFPWSSIQGVWEVESRDFRTYFSFEVQRDCDSRQILKVMQIDPNSGTVVAQGIGFQNTDSKQVYAAMQKASGGSYILFVGAYKDTSKNQNVVVLRISKFSDWTPDLNYRIHKVRNAPAKAIPGLDGLCHASDPGPSNGSGIGGLPGVATAGTLFRF